MKQIYLPYDRNIRLPMNDIIEELRKHGRAIVRDPKVMKSISMKLKPYKSKDIVFCGQNKRKNYHIITLNPGYELQRNQRSFSIKLKKY